MEHAAVTELDDWTDENGVTHLSALNPERTIRATALCGAVPPLDGFVIRRDPTMRIPVPYRCPKCDEIRQGKS